MITLNPYPDSSGYRVTYTNGKGVGEITQLADGYWYYWPNTGDYGCWSSAILRSIADKLDELNKHLGEIND